MVMNHSEYNYNGNEIAVIGMAGRFPQANDINEFWHNLVNGKECISFYSNQDLEEAGIDPQLLQQPNYIKAKGEIDRLDGFDASFFGINPKDAELMDPQHRMMLECAWAALEHAGYNPLGCGSSVGVYAGKSMSSYLFLNIYPHIQQMLAAGNLQAAIGNDKDSLTSTISYRLNLKGPSITIQSSSSTSLVSVCAAAQSLLTYQCDMALAGGITVGPPARCGYLYETGGIMAADGHCRTFDADSSGFVPGNGYGLVVLKRLEDALRDNDYIWSIIKGYAVNNDGAEKISYTAPSVNAQAEVIAQAQALAEVHPDTIGYIEAHGTGTRMGDPIEIQALTQAFRYSTDRSSYCPIGSVKTNIGHLDSAAGIAGLIKTSLALHHKQIPPTLNYKNPNPAIDFENSPFFVNTSLRDWKPQPFPRRAGVTSLGMGGTNAHVVMEEAPERRTSPSARQWSLLPFSAKTADSLSGNLAGMQDFLRIGPQAPLADVAYTLATGRQSFGHRSAVVCSDQADALLAMETSGAGNGSVFEGESVYQNRPLVFMFTGQGAQYAGMAKDLYVHEPVFRQYYEKCAGLILQYTGMDILSLMTTESNEAHHLNVDETALTQPLIFAVEYALAQLLISMGLTPQAMIGHSLGEYAAATVAGIFSLDDAVLLVCRRAEWMQQSKRGVMLAVGMTEQDIQVYLSDRISLAAVNSPGICVLSGETDAIEQLERELGGKGIFHKRLITSHAFHSPLMQPVLAPYRAMVAQLKLNAPTIPILSCLSGEWLRPEEAQDPEYWARHISEPVRFMEGMTALLQEENRLFVEVGPGFTLCGLGRQNPTARKDSVFVPALRSSSQTADDSRFLTEALAQLWVHGAGIDWTRYYANEERGRVPLPTYSFSHQSYWVHASVPFTMGDRTVDHRVVPTKAPAVEHHPETLHARPKLTTVYRAPATATESKLVEIMEQLLSIHPVGSDDNFFELGGHSLLATQVLSRINNMFHVQLPIESIFQQPTIAGLASMFDHVRESAATDSSPLDALFKQITSMDHEEVSYQLEADKSNKSGGAG